MTKELIGIGGRLAAGKDVVANFYRGQLGFTVIGFSDILHSMLMKLDPIVMTDATHKELLTYTQVVKARGFVKAKEIPEVRRLQQVFGTEIGRQMIHEDIWVDLTAERITKLQDAGKKVVLTGVRYPNEVAMVRRLGGETLWIDRPDFGQPSDHATENSVNQDDFDHLIVNDKGIAELENKAGELYMELFRNG